MWLDGGIDVSRRQSHNTWCTDNALNSLLSDVIWMYHVNFSGLSGIDHSYKELSGY